MPLPVHALEYAEEDNDNDDDLFGSPPPLSSSSAASPYLPLVNAARPVHAIPTSIGLTSSSPGAGPSRPRASATGAQERMEELRQKKLKGMDEMRGSSGKGVATLKSCCLAVARANSARIWDIGELEYPLIQPLIDDMPLEQLVEVEGKSPHIKKDTDWLWEIFLLHEFPLFHEKCRSRKGEQRESGWRRMYKKAREEADERQRNAAVHMAERYKQLEEQKAAKRIVFVDKVVRARGPGKARSRAGTVGSHTAASGSSSHHTGPKATSAIAKAKQDAQRARVALTHASGRYIPPPPSAVRQRSRADPSTEMFKNPYLPSSPRPTAQAGPRIPAPRSKAGRSDVMIPGSYPSFQAEQVRAALPAHLASRAQERLQEGGDEGSEKRFRLPDRRKPEMREIRRAEVDNFELPPLGRKPPREGDRSAVVDFFGDGQRTGSGVILGGGGVKRKRAVEVDRMTVGEGLVGGGVRRKRPSEVERVVAQETMESVVAQDTEGNGHDGDEVEFLPTPSPLSTANMVTSEANPHHPALRASPMRPKPALSAEEEAKRLNSVLFRKKPKPKGRMGG